jgi:protein SSD1
LCIIRSSAQLTYEDAQKIVDGEQNYDEDICNDVRMLYNISNCLHQTRYKKDAMFLSKQSLVFDDANHPTTVTISNARPDIVKIVKEFLFLANKCVAQKISSQYPEQALLRRQAPPNTRKIVSTTPSECILSN